MKNLKRLLIIGGDSRQIYMSQHLKKCGFDTTLFGFENADNYNSKYEKTSLSDEIKQADIIILPLPVTRDNITLNVVFSNKKILLSSIIEFIDDSKIVFGGMIPNEHKEQFKNKGVKFYDYYEREELQLLNAVPTAEGTVGLIIDRLPVTVQGMKCAILGFGRCAKVISRILKGLNAKTTVVARSIGAIASAKSEGFHTCDLCQFDEIANDFDVIINTVPAVILNKEILKLLKPDCVIIEIASAPFGVDFNAADKLDITVIKAGSLPGKTAPKTAGKIISDTIINIMREEEKCPK